MSVGVEGVTVTAGAATRVEYFRRKLPPRTRNDDEMELDREMQGEAFPVSRIRGLSVDGASRLGLESLRKRAFGFGRRNFVDGLGLISW